jgi:uncharacterized protein
MRHTPLFVALVLATACHASTGRAGDTRDIPQVQGTGERSPLEGQQVTVEGVVTASFIDGLGGVILQSERGDDDPASSDGLFLEWPRDAGPRLKVGDRVRARGTVSELGDGAATLTALTRATAEVLGSGVALPATDVAQPPSYAGGWEHYESMRISIGVPLTVTGNDGLSRFGELAVSLGGRRFAPTEVELPGLAAQAVADDNTRHTLRLDDGRGAQNPDSIWYLPGPPTDAAPLRTGSVVTGVTGVIDQRFGSYRLQLTEKPGAIEQAPRPTAPTVAGDRRIAGFNVLNLFNGDGAGGGFPTARGAASAEDYARQQAKLIAVVQALDPDLAALMELENDGYGKDSSIAQFVAALNAAGPHDDWRFVDAGEGPGNNPIRVGLIYRSSRFTTVGKPATLTDGPFADRSRAPLAQAFRAGKGPVFVVAANHFKSKGCSADAAEGDADRGDQQGCFNATRVETAQRLTDWLAGDPTGAGATGTLVIGDLNAYAQEDPLRLLREQGWKDAFVLAKAERPYSYVWSGQSGRLDHALLDAGLASRLRGAAEWHNNADEAEAFGYQQDRDNDPWRASDHDPMLLGLDLTTGGL